MLDFKQLLALIDVSAIQTVVKITLAVVLGSMIGLEREARQRQAGLRTHAVLCMGSALMTMLSFYIADNSLMQADRGRIAAQIVTGIGFLGAGAILRTGVSVIGLTTAACIWSTAGIGMAVGSGFYFGACFTTIMMLVVLRILSPLETRFFKQRSKHTLTIHTELGENTIEKILEIFKKFDTICLQLSSTKCFKTNVLELKTDIHIGDRNLMIPLFSELTKQDYVKEVHLS